MSTGTANLDEMPSLHTPAVEDMDVNDSTTPQVKNTFDEHEFQVEENSEVLNTSMSREIQTSLPCLECEIKKIRSRVCRRHVRSTGNVFR